MTTANGGTADDADSANPVSVRLVSIARGVVENNNKGEQIIECAQSQRRRQLSWSDFQAMQERIMLKIMLQKDQSLWRERRALREVDRQIITLLGQVGFSPSERGLLGTGETTQHDFSDLAKRIAEKRSASR